MWGTNDVRLERFRALGGAAGGVASNMAGDGATYYGVYIPPGWEENDAKWPFNFDTTGWRWPRKSRGSLLTRQPWCLCWRGWRQRASRLSIQKTRQWLFQARSRFRSGWLGCLLIYCLWFQISTINNLQVETASKDVPDSPRPSEGSTYKSLTPQEEVHRSQLKAE